MPEFDRILAKRAAIAREAWSSYFITFRNAGVDSASDWTSTGGLDLAGTDWDRFETTHPALYRILANEGVTAARHSHGGRYYFADPCLYVRARPWRAVRQLVDARIASSLAAMPEFIPHSSVDYFEWRGLIAILQLIHTDLCSILWNDLTTRGWTVESKIVADRLTMGLKWSSRAMLQFLPPLRAGLKNTDVADLRQPSMTLTLRGAPTSSHIANDRAIRSRRASDALFLIWSSLTRLISKERSLKCRYWVFGNAFGAIDLAFYVSEALNLAGAESVTASLCKVGGHSTGSSLEEDAVLWPMGSSAPDVIVFCDDSISSGNAYFRFKSLCQARYPTVELLPFFLSYDLNAQWNSDDAALDRFALACCATARAPWSRSLKARPATVETVDDLIAAMASSSDEQLRWMGLTQSQVIRELNAVDGNQ